MTEYQKEDAITDFEIVTKFNEMSSLFTLSSVCNSIMFYEYTFSLQAMPPVEMTVDFGDGSGEQVG